jgi:hypothetical protein
VRVRYRTVPKMATAFLRSDKVNRRIPRGLREALASAKHWYSGRIDPRKNHSVLSKIGHGVASPFAILSLRLSP